MAQHEKITEAVFRAVDEVNLQLVEQPKIEKSSDTALLGPSSNLGSLGLISLLVAIEQQVQNEFGVALNLAEDMLSNQVDNGAEDGAPLQNISTLVGYLAQCLDMEADA